MRAAPQVLVSCIRQQRNLAGALDGCGKRALMFGAGASHAAGQNFCALGNILVEAHNVFVVNMLYFVNTKRANFAAATALWGPAVASIVVTTFIRHNFVLLSW